MIRNSIKEFLQDIKTSPLNQIVAIITSAIGVSCCFIVLALFINDFKIDRYHNEFQQIYRIETAFNLPSGDVVSSAMSPFPLYDALKVDDNIKNVAFAARVKVDVIAGKHSTTTSDIYAVSDTFLSMINPFNTALAELRENEIYITHQFNDEYLGYTDPVGATIQIVGVGTFKIRGVVNTRKDTSLKFGAILKYSEIWNSYFNSKRQNWYDTAIYNFAKVHDGFDLSHDYLQMVVKHSVPQLPGAPFTAEEFISLKANEIKNIHYSSGYADDIETSLSEASLYILYLICLIIVLSTILSYFCSSSISLSSKTNSIFTKMSIGASPLQVISELFVSKIIFITTVFFLSSAFLTISYLTSNFLFGMLGDISDYALSFSAMLTLAIMLGSLTIYEGGISTFYIINKSRSLSVTRYSNAKVTNTNSILIGLQLLLAGVITFIAITTYIKNESVFNVNYGYKSTDILTFEVPEDNLTVNHLHGTFNRTNLSNTIENYTVSSWRPFDMSRMSIGLKHSKQTITDEYLSVNAIYAGKDILKVLGLSTLAGIENSIKTNSSSNELNAIVTESFLDEFGFNSYTEVLNNKFFFKMEDDEHSVNIIRIVDNFHLGSPLEENKPVLIIISTSPQRYGLVSFINHINADDFMETMANSGVMTSRAITIDDLKKNHFNEQETLNSSVKFLIIVIISMLFFSSILVGISETQKLKQTLGIMEALGGSVYTSIIYILSLNSPIIIISSGLSYILGANTIKLFFDISQETYNQVIFTCIFPIMLISLVVIFASISSFLFSRTRITGFIQG
ncbi:hypothetical protein [Photobacterium kasasachensis]|uniref:hypothetical protein n=1 Tax=Photobacterium kasasachensis TaxID=2910240 RepID=UPI003D10BF39